MILAWIIIVLLAGGLAAWFLARWDPLWARRTCLFALLLDLALAVSVFWLGHIETGAAGLPETGAWLIELNVPWIPQLGIGLHLAVDGLSLVLVLLTIFLGLLSLSSAWSEITGRVGFFHFNLMWILAGIAGVFMSLDMFLFYFFWEMMLVPMYFLIAIWGHENRQYASVKFFIFTQASGLLMLLSILGLFFIHGANTGDYTFDYTRLLGTQVSPSIAIWLMLGFFIAFAVKLPAVPFHSWLPDAHTEAPTAGSIILAGLLLKTGAYGFIRFLIPLFPDMAARFAPVAMGLAVASIIYGAVLAFAQNDLKRLIADTSISHMGFVLLGVYAWNGLALEGALMQIISHGISTGMLFMMVGSIQERIHTRDMDVMGGLWPDAPRMGGVMMVFALASLGLPGMGNFLGEFLVLFGTYRVSSAFAVIASLGFVLSTIYSIWMIQRTFHGEKRGGYRVRDLSSREMAASAVMIAAIIWLGVYPQPVMDTASPAFNGIQGAAKMQKAPDPVSGRPSKDARAKSIWTLTP
ncbi:MAG: NADH-quinone oxidoreductase subunit M [Nitrospiraceae bacterium]|nr:NADH-quinone oxidoreductase subunit M [Nitrospiraceae bacterium]